MVVVDCYHRWLRSSLGFLPEGVEWVVMTPAMGWFPVFGFRAVLEDCDGS